MTPRKGFLGGQSPEQVQTVLDQGLTQRALAQWLGVTHQAVSRFVRRHGLRCGGRQAYRTRRADWVVERRVKLRQLLKEGRTRVEVVALLGVSSATIRMDRRALGLGRALKPPERRTLRGLGRAQVEARLQVRNRAQLARELGLSSSAVYRYCKTVGVSHTRRSEYANVTDR
ncbi:hypothetical protein [Xanthomonas graminis]|uniref:hypothetical protein n=1 Tax=Xanthomonas graminis TaxID=3390026 RepID=UPI00083B11DD|nr:hypothetical protein [Xanthomonas translucens]